MQAVKRWPCAMASIWVAAPTSIGSRADQYSFFSSTIVEPASFAYIALFSCRSEEEERLMAQLKKREIRSVISNIIAWGYMSVHSERENISMF